MVGRSQPAQITGGNGKRQMAATGGLSGGLKGEAPDFQESSPTMVETRRPCRWLFGRFSGVFDLQFIAN